ncbi:hypothetical protein R3P38DRAFT_1084308 [Favolaschia claudopus]|uniref:Uncharacterized protein n=1 Tax=Favolaschia claudopus TaxID=2862362 RepID=A0AAW0BCW4_9AGAR
MRLSPPHVHNIDSISSCSTLTNSRTGAASSAPRLRPYHAEELKQTPPLHPSKKVIVYSSLVLPSPSQYSPHLTLCHVLNRLHTCRALCLPFPVFSLFPFRFWVFCSGFLYVQYLDRSRYHSSHLHLPYIRNLHRLLPQKILSFWFLLFLFLLALTGPDTHHHSCLLACDCNCASRCYPFPITVYTSKSALSTTAKVLYIVFKIHVTYRT